MNPSGTNNQWASAFFDSITAAEEAAVAVAADNVLPRFMDHSYHDFSTYISDGGKIEKHKKSDRNFPARLHAILGDEQYAHIIAWMPHGRAWRVLDKKLLVDVVIPKFFGQSKFASFTRQLSGWGFKRLHQTGRDFGCYYHECFLRGHPRLTVLMRRSSPGKGKATPNINSEPDFYAIAKQYPLLDTGEKPVFSPELESKRKKRRTESKPTVKEPPISDEVTSFDPLPFSSRDNLEPPAALPSSSGSDSSVNQYQGNNGTQYFGKAQDETGRIHTAPMFSDQYHAGGNLYQNVQTRSQPQTQTNTMAPASICAEDGLCPTDTSSCSRSGHHHQHSVGNIVPYPYPPHAQSLYHDPSTSHRNSVGYGSMNIYGQHQSHNAYFQQGQMQGLGQPAYCSSGAAATSSQPKRFSYNGWDDTAAAHNDALKEMPMSIPEKGFDFNVSSIEDSFCNSFVDTTSTFLG